MSQLTREKIAQAKALVAESDADIWLTFVRETSGGSDPVLPFLTESALTWQSALLVSGAREAMAVVGNYDADPLLHAGDWDEVVPYVQGIRQPLLDTLNRLTPTKIKQPKIAINVSESDDKSDGLTFGMYRLLKGYLEGTRFEGGLISAEPIVRALRGRKSRTELARIEAAILAGDELFAEIGEFARIGVSERAIYDRVHAKMADRGLGFAWEASGDPIVNCGPDSMIGHGIPSARLPLLPGQLLHVDLGVVLNGYSSDIQRCWFVGDAVPDDIADGLAAVNAAIDAGASALKPGVLGWEVDASARAAIIAGGYPEYLHALGHQVGRLAHDGGGILGPRWERYGETPLWPVEEGQIYTLELGVTLEGRGYLGIEEMVVVTKSGCEFLSKRQRDMPLIPTL